MNRFCRGTLLAQRMTLSSALPPRALRNSEMTEVSSKNMIKAPIRGGPRPGPALYRFRARPRPWASMSMMLSVCPLIWRNASKLIRTWVGLAAVGNEDRFHPRLALGAADILIEFAAGKCRHKGRPVFVFRCYVTTL